MSADYLVSYVFKTKEGISANGAIILNVTKGYFSRETLDEVTNYLKNNLEEHVTEFAILSFSKFDSEPKRKN